jgi:MoaA/NifB/PqqE/SkfB family radical SAM enzyme
VIQAPTYDEVRSYIEQLCRDCHFYVHLEPTNACNTSCVMCPRGQMTRIPRLMDWGVFKAAMELLLPTEIPMISLVGFGEPTLHKRLVEMIAYIRRRRPEMILKLTTNGSRLSAQYIDELYSAGLDLIEVSVVGTDPESYQAAMGGLSLGPVLQAFKHLNNRGYTWLLTTFVTGDQTPETIRDFWHQRGVKNIEVKGFHTRGGYLSGVTGRLSADGLGSYVRREPPVKDLASTADACHKLYMFLHLNSDGNFIPCVQEINNHNVICRLDQVKSYQDIRHILRSARPTFDICTNCELKNQELVDYYTRFLIRYFPERTRTLMARRTE